MLAAACMPGSKRQKGPFSASEWTEAVGETYALARDHGISLAGVQIFLCGPASYKSLLSSPGVFDALRSQSASMRARDKRCGRFLVHGHYLTALVWRGDDVGPRKHLAGQMFAATGIGAEGVVVHLPSLEPKPLVSIVSDVIGRARAGRLWLETSAEMPRTGWGYADPGQLAALARELDDKGLMPRAGLCVDTAHVWSQGHDSVVTYDGFEELLRPAREACDATLPLMVHLNDCSLARGAGRDIHAPVGRGLIWPDFDDAPSSTGAAAAIDAVRESKGLAVLERSNREALADDFAALGRLQLD